MTTKKDFRARMVERFGEEYIKDLEGEMPGIIWGVLEVTKNGRLHVGPCQSIGHLEYGDTRISEWTSEVKIFENKERADAYWDELGRKRGITWKIANLATEDLGEGIYRLTKAALGGV